MNTEPEALRSRNTAKVAAGDYPCLLGALREIK